MSIKISNSSIKNHGIASYAEKHGLKYTSIPLKDKSSVKILEGEDEVTFLKVKKNNILEAKGYKGSSEDLTFFITNTLAKIQEMALDGIDVVSEYMKSFKR